MKKLVKHGNSYALIIDKPILELLRIDADTPLEVLTDGQRIFVQPQREGMASEQLKEALEWLHTNYGDCFKRLAQE